MTQGIGLPEAVGLCRGRRKVIGAGKRPEEVIERVVLLKDDEDVLDAGTDGL